MGKLVCGEAHISGGKPHICSAQPGHKLSVHICCCGEVWPFTVYPKKSAPHQELVAIRVHFFKHYTPGELVDFFCGRRGRVDEAGREAIAKLLFGENATVEQTEQTIKKRGL
jgi:hypothetical protein